MRRLLGTLLAAVLFVGGCGKELTSPTEETKGYERVVLAELFTATWCPNCPKAEEAIDQLYEEEGLPAVGGESDRIRLAVIHWHPGDGSDPMGITEMQPRLDAYEDKLPTSGEDGLPTIIFDGVDRMTGAETVPYAEYRSSFAHEREVRSHLRLDIRPHAGPQGPAALVTVESDAEAVADELELTVVLIEDGIRWPDIPTGELYSFVARMAQTQTVTLAASDEEDYDFEFVLGEEAQAWDSDEFYFVAFLQQPEYGDVVQATMQSLLYSSVELTAPATDILVRSEPDTVFVPFEVINSGTIDDSLRLEIAYDSMIMAPTDWWFSFGVADTMPDASVLTMDLALASGVTLDTYGVWIRTTGGQQTGTFDLELTSHLRPTFSESLTFDVEAGTLGFTAITLESSVTAEIYGQAAIHLVLTNTGTLGDSLHIESIPDSLPEDWITTICTEVACLGPEYTTWLAAAEVETLFVDIIPGSAGSGTEEIRITSVSDPALSDTLYVECTTEITYDFTLSVPDTIVADPTVPRSVHTEFMIENIGVLRDSLSIEIVAELVDLPAGWTVYLGSTGGGSWIAPLELGLDPEARIDSLYIVVEPDAAGIGEVGLRVTSLNDPTKTETVTIDYILAEIGFDAAMPETSLVAPLGVILGLDLDLENTGDLDDRLIIDCELTGLPSDFNVSVCDDRGTCYGLPHPIEIAAGASEEYEVHFQALTEGSGTATISVTSELNPALRETFAIPIEAETQSANFDHIILAELFTSLSCANCPKAEAAIDSLLHEETPEKLIVIEWHTLLWVNQDPWLGIPETDARITDFYGFLGGLPKCLFNGTALIEGTQPTTEETYDDYRAAYDPLTGFESPLALDLCAEISGNEILTTLSIDIASGAGLGELELVVVSIADEQKHPKPDKLIQAHVVREATNQTIDLTGRESLTPTIQALGVPPSAEPYSYGELLVVAFVQDAATRQVVQAAMVSLGAPPAARLAKGGH